MKRRLFNLLAALSLLLLVAAAVLWGWTSGTYRNVRFSRVVAGTPSAAWECFDLSAHCGAIRIGRMVIWNYRGASPGPGWKVETSGSPRSTVAWVSHTFAGFGATDKTWDATATVRRRTQELVVPLWAVIALCAVLPALAARRLYRQTLCDRRRRHGRCPHCGYDLRASPERCPECGGAATTEAKA